MSAASAKVAEDALPLVSFGIGVAFEDQRNLELRLIYQQIQAPSKQHKELIEYLRQLAQERAKETDEERIKQLSNQIDRIKKSLPAFTASGMFPVGKRKAESLIQHSGRLQIDIDKLPADQVQIVKQQLASDPHIEVTFISPTETGVKAIILIPICDNAKQHKNAFLAAERYLKHQYNLQIDQSCKDVTRLLFASYDPDLVLNRNAAQLDIFKWQPKKPEPQQTKTRLDSFSKAKAFAESKLDEACREISNAPAGSRNAARLKYSFTIAGYVAGEYLDKSTALEQLIQAARENSSNPEKAEQDIHDGFSKGLLEPLHPSFQDNGPYIRKAKEQPTYKARVVNGRIVPEVDKEQIIWQSPVEFNQPKLPTVNLDLLPSWLSDYTKHLSLSTETPPELALAMTLASCATATARRFRVRIKRDYFEPTNLWLLCALPPGNRKSVVQRSASKPLYDWEKEQSSRLEPEIKKTQSERKTQEARIKELRKKAAQANRSKGLENTYDELNEEINELEANLPEIEELPQLWTSDVPPEKLGTILSQQQERIAWLSSEGGVFDLLQGRYSGGIVNLDLFLKTHSGDSERVDRISRPPIYLKNPILTFGLSPQPSVLSGLVSKPGFRGRGLLGRFLYLLPASPLGYRTLDAPEMPLWVEETYHKGIKRLLDLPLATNHEKELTEHILQFTPEAFEEWREFSRYLETQMRQGEPLEHITDWAGKCPGATARLAAILHAVEYAETNQWQLQISKKTFDKASELMLVFVEHAKAAFELMGADETFQAAKKVLEWIERKRQEQFFLRDCFNELRANFSRAQELRSALQLLEERHYLQILEAQSEGVGRKRSELILVNPELVKEDR